MTHVVAEPCFNCKYTDCVVVCPVDCFYEGESMLFIHPDECIDCEVCVPECPPQAIFHHESLPEEWKDYSALNAEMVEQCPRITETQESIGGPMYEFAGEGKHFIAYHNTEKIGHEFNGERFVPGERWNWSTKKSPEQFLGGKIWCVSGQSSPRRYLAYGWYEADEIEAMDDGDFPFVICGDVGFAFPKPVCLNDQPWIAGFLKSQSNFSLGMQQIHPDFVRELEELGRSCRDLQLVVPSDDGGKQAPSTPTQQGFQASPEDRKLIESYAVGWAKEHFEEQGFVVEVVGKPFDLRCTRESEFKFVEVKGTVGQLGEVILTKNEVEFARQNRSQMVLFVVHGIQLVDDAIARVAVGGDVFLQDPWVVDEHGELTANQYRYRLQADGMLLVVQYK
ncbi:DUF3883 domain-containing protein [Planctellipticum variicoloris]|nr:DUF3883 domain-containing protein [Planctomycetaceae bacterium SH412]